MRLFYPLIVSLVLGIITSANAGRPIEEPTLTPISGVLSLIDPATGQSKDLLQVDHQSLGRPFVLGNAVYVAGSGRTLYALDVQTGKTIWKFAADAPLFGVVATAKAIFVGTSGTLNALDPASGNLIWKYEGDMAVVDPVLVDDAIVINSLDGPVAIEQATGKLRWRLAVQWGYFVFSPLSEHRLCVWKPDEIYVVETERGKTLWQNAPDQTVSPPGAIPTAAVAIGDIIFQLRGSPTDSEDWSLHARSAGSGLELWKTALGPHESTGKTTITDHAVFAIFEDEIAAMDLTAGTLKWRAKVKPLEAGGALPIAGHGLLFVPELGGDITALDEKSGKQTWINPAAKPTANGKIRLGGLSVSEAGLYVTRNEVVRQ